MITYKQSILNGYFYSQELLIELTQMIFPLIYLNYNWIRQEAIEFVRAVLAKTDPYIVKT